MRKYLIALDDGHGMTTAGKRTPSIPELGGRVIHENEFNREVVKYLDIELKRCGFNTLLVAPTDADTSLSARTNLANSKNADAYISIHYNAFDGKFDDYDPEGLSVHIYPKSVEGRKLAECVLKYLKEGTSQKNRGIKENNFHVLRETKMVAILSENGFMDNKREALLMLNVDFQKEVAKEHAKGICDYFGVKYVEEPAENKTTIIGKSGCSAAQLEKFLLSKNQNPKLNISVKEFCELWISEGEIENVRGDIAFCQACHETGYFKYGGQVLPEQNNYGGIGAVNNSPVGKGAWFDTPQIGVRASIQHLKGYASSDKLSTEVVDPRYSILQKYKLVGTAPNFEDLGGKWAYPGYNTSKYPSLEAAKAAKDTYGHFIVRMYEELKKVIVDEQKEDDVSEWAKDAHDFVTKNNISDGKRPKENVTREEMWTMIYNYSKMKN